MTKTGRNEACPCGSGKKYKRCCGENPSAGDSIPQMDAARFRYQEGSYGGPGGYFPSILCYKRTGPDSWTEHFCLVNPTVIYEDEDHASAVARHRLDRAFSIAEERPDRFAMALKSFGFKSVTDFKMAKDAATVPELHSEPRPPLGFGGIEQVSFITTSSGTDLIVSFAIPCGSPCEVLSLTLLRTPKYESFLDEAKRGVLVSNETDEDDDEYLLELVTRGHAAEIRTNRHQYWLDLAQVSSTTAANAAPAVTPPRPASFPHSTSWPPCACTCRTPDNS
jgi:hypothetical protein